MKRKITVLALSAMLFAFSFSVEAQQSAKVPKVGWLGARPGGAGGQETIRRMLRDLGYVEGKNIAFEQRFADNKLDRLPALADELVRLKVDVLVTAGPGVTRVAKEATVRFPLS